MIYDGKGKKPAWFNRWCHTWDEWMFNPKDQHRYSDSFEYWGA